MKRKRSTILAVDDEPMNLEIIEAYLDGEGYRLVTAQDGAEAWALLRENPCRFDAVLLDRMMPKMDGMALLSCMKATPALMPIPVILQTAAAAPSHMCEGLNAGAYYYLGKPFEQDPLRAIVRAALRDYAQYCALRSETLSISGAAGLLASGLYRFRTPADARGLAALLAGAFPNSVKCKVSVGICELLLNAVEHGNLGLTYQDKSRLLALGRDRWDEEVDRRLTMPLYGERMATVEFIREPGALSVVVTDQGDGFDWRPYLDFSLDRAYDAHGRGIATARQMCFTKLEYRGRGNEVAAILDLPAPGMAQPASCLQAPLATSR